MLWLQLFETCFVLVVDQLPDPSILTNEIKSCALIHSCKFW